MSDKHTVHLRDGGKVIIDGDRVELHLAAPLVFHRKHWIQYFPPSVEASRAVSYANVAHALADKVAEAFAAVPMVVYREDDPR